MPLEGRDIVLLYAPPWDGAARFSKHHLARHLTTGGRNRLLYVEAPLGPLSVLNRRAAALPEVRATLQAPRQVEPALWVHRYFNPVPYHDVTPITASRQANSVGQRLLAGPLRRDLQRLGFSRPLVIAGLPHALDVLPPIGSHGLVYHCSDDFSHVKGFPRSLPSLEEDLCRASDVVIATAETLCESRRRWNPNTFWVPNGVELEHFVRPVPPSKELAGLGRPLVGFVGGLAQWVDVELIAHVARSRPDWQVVLVGPLSTDLSPLDGLANVRLLGPRPYDAVPGYLAAMDVAMIPFRRDEVTRQADPIKAYEYLAAGVPVVAIDLPALRRLSHVIRLANTSDEFISALDQAISAGREHDRDERRAEAQRHSWTARFQLLEEILVERLPA